MSHLHLLHTSKVDREWNEGETDHSKQALYHPEPVNIGKTLVNERQTIMTTK